MKRALTRGVASVVSVAVLLGAAGCGGGGKTSMAPVEKACKEGRRSMRADILDRHTHLYEYLQEQASTELLLTKLSQSQLESIDAADDGYFPWNCEALEGSTPTTIYVPDITEQKAAIAVLRSQYPKVNRLATDEAGLDLLSEICRGLEISTNHLEAIMWGSLLHLDFREEGATDFVEAATSTTCPDKAA